MRVLITGIGIVTANGMGKRGVAEAFFSGKDGCGLVERFDTRKFKHNRGYEIKQDWPDFRNGDATRLMRLGLWACTEALRDSGLQGGKDIGLVIGSGLGDETFVSTLALESTLRISHTYAHRPGPQIASRLNLGGGVISNGTACTAGLNAIIHGHELVRNGEIASIVAGGVETFTANSFAYFNRITTGLPQRVCPFDKNRQGMLLGEGAGFIVLESEDHAMARQKPAYGEILGYGLSGDAFHISNMHLNGVTLAIERALQHAQLEPMDIDYIAAHGTGTPINDIVETEAIKRAFGKRAYSVPVSSVKSMIGHTGGASGAINLISALMTMACQKLPPTINYKDPDPQCDLDYVPNTARPWAVRNVLVNAFGFGGANCAVVVTNTGRSTAKECKGHGC